MSEVNLRDYKSLPSFAYAGFFIRLLAFVIDIILISAINRIVSNMIDPNVEIGLGLSLGVIIYWIISLAYFTLLTYFNNGQTLGKMITNIRVVSLDGGPLSLWQVVSRETFGRYVQNKFMILYAIVGFAPMKQSLADILSDTTVVRENVDSYLSENRLSSEINL